MIFEIDSEELLRLWQRRLGDRSLVRPILDEISELGLSFSSFDVVHVCREANQAAHSCAKYESIQEGSFSLDAEPPGFLVHSLKTDCNFVDVV